MPLKNGRVLSSLFSALLSQRDVYKVDEAIANLGETELDQDRVRLVTKPNRKKGQIKIGEKRNVGLVKITRKQRWHICLVPAPAEER